MKSKTKIAALVYAGLKFSQQTLHDLDSIILNNTTADIVRFGTEQITRLSAAGAAAYALDQSASYLEEHIIPKPIKGGLTLLATTLGVGAAIHCFSQYMNVEQTSGIIEATKQVVSNYYSNLIKLVTFDPSAHAGYLTGAFVTIKSGCRLLKNLGEHLAYTAEKKRIEYKQKKADELTKAKTELNQTKNNK